jgi:hypothetical protein
VSQTRGPIFIPPRPVGAYASEMLTMTRSPEPSAPLIAVISGTPTAIAPAVAGLQEGFPGAAIWNILDDRLLVDADQAGGVDARLRQRMTRLIEHAKAEGAQGVLLTCSMYGSAARQFDGTDVPVFGADDAIFAAVLDASFRRVLFVASFGSALADAVARFGAFAAGASPHIETVVPEGAFAATNAGDSGALIEALVAGCRPFVGAVDAVILAQYSLAPATEALSSALGLPVLSGPLKAAALLRHRVEGAK